MNLIFGHLVSFEYKMRRTQIKSHIKQNMIDREPEINLMM